MKTERPFSELIPFLPPDTFEQVIPYFQSHTIHLTLTRERKSILGDYRNPTISEPYHRISINANLNPYSFLITLLHELAHMLVYLQYKHSVQAHGAEWKGQFRKMLIPYLDKGFFPANVERALIKYINNPKASTCTDKDLYKALYEHSAGKSGWLLLEGLSVGQRFEIDSGERYEILEKKRTRFKCRQIRNGKLYLFPSIYEVKPVDS